MVDPVKLPIPPRAASGAPSSVMSAGTRTPSGGVPGVPASSNRPSVRKCGDAPGAWGLWFRQDTPGTTPRELAQLGRPSEVSKTYSPQGCAFISADSLNFVSGYPGGLSQRTKATRSAYAPQSERQLSCSCLGELVAAGARAERPRAAVLGCNTIGQPPFT